MHIAHEWPQVARRAAIVRARVFTRRPLRLIARWPPSRIGSPREWRPLFAFRRATSSQWAPTRLGAPHIISLLQLQLHSLVALSFTRAREWRSPASALATARTATKRIESQARSCLAPHRTATCEWAARDRLKLLHSDCSLLFGFGYCTSVQYMAFLSCIVRPHVFARARRAAPRRAADKIATGARRKCQSVSSISRRPRRVGVGRRACLAGHRCQCQCAFCERCQPTLGVFVVRFRASPARTARTARCWRSRARLLYGDVYSVARSGATDFAGIERRDTRSPHAHAPDMRLT